MGELIFVTGGARSGKSSFAETLAGTHTAPVIYLATMEALDEETMARVARHRQQRPRRWQTIEEPLDLAGVVRLVDTRATVLVDCLGLWVSNLFMDHGGDGTASPEKFEDLVGACLAAAEDVLAEQQRRPGTLIAVSNEVGWGIVPADRLSRYYRDALGLVNQRFAAMADEAILLVSGLPLWLIRRGATGQGDARVSERGPQSGRTGRSQG